jgi:hypothetical protein
VRGFAHGLDEPAPSAWLDQAGCAARLKNTDFAIEQPDLDELLEHQRPADERSNKQRDDDALHHDVGVMK